MSAVKVFAGFIGIVKVVLSALTSPTTKVIAPLPSPTRVHVKSVKVAVPPEDAFVVVPPIVQAPVPALAVATTLLVDDTPVVQ